MNPTQTTTIRHRGGSLASLFALLAALAACGGGAGGTGGPSATPTPPATPTPAATPTAAPTISAISPSSGPSTGATAVTIDGTGFAAGIRVRFGGVDATQVVVSTATQLVAVAPAHAEGAVDVDVVDAGLATATLAGAFTYVAPPPPPPPVGLPPPAITGIAPTSGPASGSTVVILSGTGFASGCAVSIGGTPTTIGSVTSTTITLTTAGGVAGPADVTITNPDRQSETIAGGFTYLAAPPVVSAINVHGSPQAGGGLLLFAGSGLDNTVSVTFGGASATGLVHDPVPGTLQVTIPPSPLGPTADGFVDLVLTNGDGQTTTWPGFHYGNPPGATGFTPTIGAKGTVMVIDGVDFTADATGPRAGLQVSFGGNLATITQKSPTQITVTVPKLNPGVYQVIVTNFDSQYSVAPGTFTVPGP